MSFLRPFPRSLQGFLSHKHEDSKQDDFIKELKGAMRHGPRYEEDSENAWNCCSWFEYLLIVILSTVLLIGVLVLTLFWVIFYRGGFAWADSPQLQFNLHPVLMVAGCVTFSGFCKNIFESHNLVEPPKPHFYSLHTWLGLITMAMFAVQFIVGFFSFLVLLCCENRTYSCRSAMVPIHASFGLANFMMAVATCVTGLVETERQLVGETGLSTRNSEIEHYIMNSMGVVFVALGIIISVAVRRSNAPATAKVYVTERLEIN
ncbi:hypothetical protein GQX74_000374 [Glossina fuscipes]|nr:hypothetical protein GQX74_000374 [Glossina fuscipes]